MTVDLDAVVDELYGLPATEFTAERDRKAAEARAAGDKETAASIKALKRPSTSAWLLNQLVRQRRSDVDDLLDLAGRLRDAHTQLAGAELRVLSQERQRAVPALVRVARTLAGESGLSIGANIARELHETIEAAISDPASAAALRAGRLTTALRYSGVGGALETSETAALRSRKEADAAVAAAAYRVTETQALLEQAEGEVVRMRRLIEDLRDQLSDLEARSARTEQRLAAVRQEAEDARAADHAARAHQADLNDGP